MFRKVSSQVHRSAFRCRDTGSPTRMALALIAPCSRSAVMGAALDTYRSAAATEPRETSRCSADQLRFPARPTEPLPPSSLSQNAGRGTARTRRPTQRSWVACPVVLRCCYGCPICTWGISVARGVSPKFVGRARSDPRAKRGPIVAQVAALSGRPGQASGLTAWRTASFAS